MKKTEYIQSATGYYVRRYTANNSRRMWSSETIQFEATVMFNAVEAGMKSIAPGRQNAKTRGWNDDGLLAHRRASVKVV